MQSCTIVKSLIHFVFRYALSVFFFYSCVPLVASEEANEGHLTVAPMKPDTDMDSGSGEDGIEDEETCDQTLCGSECVDLNQDQQHCGQCDHACDVNNAISSCELGICTITSCVAHFIDQNGLYDDGCELEECDPGGTCMSSCGSLGVLSCDDQGQLFCQPAVELCNLEDEDCDGKLDEELGDSCRIGVHRGFSGEHHTYSVEMSELTAFPYHIEIEDYFTLYREDLGGLLALYKCQKASGVHFLSHQANCEGNGTLVRQLGYLSPHQRADALPLYHLYLPTMGDHLYTVEESEKTLVLSRGWELRSTMGFVWSSHGD